MYRIYASSRDTAIFIFVFFLEKFYDILEYSWRMPLQSSAQYNDTAQKLHWSGLKINVKQSFRDSHCK